VVPVAPTRRSAPRPTGRRRWRRSPSLRKGVELTRNRNVGDSDLFGRINKKAPPFQEGLFYLYGAPGEIRTPDRLVRSQVLYPAELRARKAVHYLEALSCCQVAPDMRSFIAQWHYDHRFHRSPMTHFTYLGIHWFYFLWRRARDSNPR
jgi:hypothetical protein